MTIPVEHYTQIEKALQGLLQSIPEIETAGRNDVQHFIDVGEYGLALETLVGSLVENQHSVVPELARRIRLLAEQMDLKDSPIFRHL